MCFRGKADAQMERFATLHVRLRAVEPVVHEVGGSTTDPKSPCGRHLANGKAAAAQNNKDQSQRHATYSTAVATGHRNDCYEYCCMPVFLINLELYSY